jgi:hypothetical protein
MIASRKDCFGCLVDSNAIKNSMSAYGIIQQIISNWVSKDQFKDCSD